MSKSALIRSLALVSMPLFALSATVSAATARAHESGAPAATPDASPAATDDPIDPGDLLTQMRMRGFGASVAVDDGRVFVGESRNLFRPGTVYVYERDDSGAWVEVARVTAPDAVRQDGFGAAVAARDGLLYVGAPGTASGRGAVHVYRLDGGDWEHVRSIAPESVPESANFGSTVELADDGLLIGAPGGDDRAGAIYAFHQTGEDAWAMAGKVMAADSAAGTRFGSEIAVAHDRMLVGAPLVAEGSGAVYMFERADDGWRQIAVLAPEESEARMLFGRTAAFMPDGAVLVGAPRAVNGSGAVFVYRFDADDNEWDQEGALLPFDGGRLFGMAIASTADELWIGGVGADGFRGAVYIYEPGAETGEWSDVRKLTPEAEGRGGFGAPIAIEDGVAVIGRTNAGGGSGQVMIYELATRNQWLARATLMGPPDAMDPIVGGKIECEDGRAAIFACTGVDLVSFLPNIAIGASRGAQTNDIWGWTDPETGKEYALVGRTDGTAFVDISNPTNPVYVGELLRTEGSPKSTWRDIKVYENHAYIVADGAAAHGVQVFDLTRLRDYDGEPIQFEPETTYHNVYSVHNIAINKATGFAYAVGSGGGGTTCGGGLHMINIQDPENPEFAGCFSAEGTGRDGTGYSHDAQCVIYHGPDEEYEGREICFGFNETAVVIADVTDKDNPVEISRVSYPNVAYTHQGWLTEDHAYVLSNDELDEVSGSVNRTRTLVWDVRDLDDPQLIDQYMGETGAIDHNLYIKDGVAYESNYTSGLRIIDISDINNPVETAFFDVAPYHVNDEPSFGGTWSNYPFFESGVIPVTSSEYGVFFLKLAEPPATSE